MRLQPVIRSKATDRRMNIVRGVSQDEVLPKVKRDLMPSK
jgi:hypothetical protein